MFEEHVTGEKADRRAETRPKSQASRGLSPGRWRAVTLPSRRLPPLAGDWLRAWWLSAATAKAVRIASRSREPGRQTCRFWVCPAEAVVIQRDLPGHWGGVGRGGAVGGVCPGDSTHSRTGLAERLQVSRAHGIMDKKI